MGVVKTSARSTATSPRRAEVSTSDASTRQRVLDLLLANGALTAAELADHLDLTATGVRRHLSSLLVSGEISAKDQTGSRGRGRPAKVFQLTHTGRQGFGQAYDDLALSALGELAAALGPESIERLAEKRLADVEDDYLRRRAADPKADPAEVLAAALSAAGYFASTDENGQLCLHHCPVAHVAAKFPQL